MTEVQINNGQSIQTYFEKNSSYDITFEVGSKKLYGHKFIVASRSSPLKSLIEKGDQVIKITNCTPDIFSICLNYIYTDKASFSESNIYKVCAAAEQFELLGLKVLCFDDIYTHICNTPSKTHSFITSFQKGELGFYSAKELLRKLLLKQPEEFITNSAFLDLTEEHLIYFLQSSEHAIEEIQIFNRVLEWTKKRKDQNDFSKVISNIRFPLISRDDLENIVKKTGLCPTQIYSEALDYNDYPNVYENYLDIRFKGRGSSFQGSTLVTAKEAVYLSQWTKKKCSWKVIYKASINGWSTNDFHKFCDGKGENITVIKSKNGYIFGGYNPKGWSSNGGYSVDKDFFLFSLVGSQGPTLVKQNTSNTAYAAYNASSYGPTFGGGHDLYICGNPNNSTSSYTNLGYTYLSPVGNYGSNEAKNFLAGSYNFTVSEIEVFVPKN